MEYRQIIKVETCEIIVREYRTYPDNERIIVIIEDKETGELTIPLSVLSEFLGYDSPDDMLSTDDWLDILSAIKAKNIDKSFPLNNGNLQIRNFHYSGEPK